MSVTGVNHVTFVTSDIERALGFWRDLLGARLRARWPTGAYLELGTLWLCLEAGTPVPSADESHLALSVSAADFDRLADRVRAAAPVWKENRSEGASLYVLDPDGRKLELHVGDLASRLAAYAGRSDVTIFA